MVSIGLVPIGLVPKGLLLLRASGHFAGEISVHQFGEAYFTDGRGSVPPGGRQLN